MSTKRKVMNEVNSRFVYGAFITGMLLAIAATVLLISQLNTLVENTSRQTQLSEKLLANSNKQLEITQRQLAIAQKQLTIARQQLGVSKETLQIARDSDNTTEALKALP